MMINSLNCLRRDSLSGDGPESHIVTKKGTPTMGGLLILVAFGVSSLLWIPVASICVALFVSIGYGLIGFSDDYLKIKRRTQEIPGRQTHCTGRNCLSGNIISGWLRPFPYAIPLPFHH